MHLNLLRSTTTRLSKLHRLPTTRYFTSTTATMGVTKTILKEGNGPIPKVGDKVTIEYTGFLKDTNKPENKGNQYASSFPCSCPSLC
jgi:FKBP-type peptidyl-prolyl cis-trans isomerase